MFGNTVFHDGRYMVRQATMAALIANAYGIDERTVQGGPNWLEWNKFDITAKAPADTKPDDQELMLRSLLRDRFHLAVHNGTAPMPAWALVADHPKLKAGSAAGDDSAGADAGPEPGSGPGCHPVFPQQGGPGNMTSLTISCHDATMAQFAQNLQWLGNGVLNDPVTDATGLKGTYDFDMQWTPPYLRRRSGEDGINLFDAVQRLGLRLEKRTAPAPVLIVDSVSETPTPNDPNIAKEIPPPPPASFDVAVIKPSQAGGFPRARIRGNQLDVSGMPLKFFIDFAWGLNFNDGEMMANAPPWLADARFDIIAKNTTAPPSDAPNGNADIEQLRQMLRTLITDRFELKTHVEQRPVDAYVLQVDDPKMEKADPTSRTKCSNGPGPDGKDPRTANPQLDRLIYCQNVTMEQFASALSSLAPGYFEYPVVNETGLSGSFDFTLSFSSVRRSIFGTGPAPTPAAGGQDAAPSAAEPTGEVPLPDAIRKQLGLKLEKVKRPEPVLVIDHIDQQPTPN